MSKTRIKRELKNERTILACAQEFSMVGDPTRLKICYQLWHHKELSVGDLADMVGVSISAVSHTLKRLEEADMVESRREFHSVYYKLKENPVIRVMIERINHYAKV